MASHQESQLKCLLFIQPWIAVRRIVEAEVFLHEPLATSHTLRDSLTSQLEMHTSEICAVFAVYPESRRDFR